MSRGNNHVLTRFTPRRALLVGMFLGLVMFTVAAAGVLLNVDQEAIRDGPAFARQALWLVVVLCPVFAVDMAVRIVRRTPNVVATEEGLVFRSILGFSPPIPWREIASVGPVVMGKKLYLGIFLEDPVATFARFGTGMRLMHAKSHARNVPNVTFRAIHLGVNPVEAAEVLEQFRRERAV